MSKNPYERLKGAVSAWAFKVTNPRQVVSFSIPNARNSQDGIISALYQRTVAANACNHDVVVVPNGEHLSIEFRERAPLPPYEIR